MAASERDEGRRRAWREHLSGVDPRRLVFVNECSTNAALATRYARAPKGQRTRGRAPRNWGKNVTLNSSISLVGTGPSLSIEGPADDEAFRLYLRELLCPALARGQIVVMDYLLVRKSARVGELIEERGAEARFLPAYSPDLDPIEEAFSKVKGVLRRAGARTLRELFEATHRALGAVTEQDARGFFVHSDRSGSAADETFRCVYLARSSPGRSSPSRHCCLTCQGTRPIVEHGLQDALWNDETWWKAACGDPSLSSRKRSFSGPLFRIFYRPHRYFLHQSSEEVTRPNGAN